MWSSRAKSATTDASGRFEIKGLAKGRVVLSASRDDHSGYEFVEAGDTNVKIVVRKQSPNGRGPTTRTAPPDDDDF